MPSLKEWMEMLEQDLVADPMRISVYHDLPFALFRYPPRDEFAFRKQVRLLAHSLTQRHARKVHFVSLAKLLWESVRDTVGVQSIVDLEKSRGFEKAQETVNAIIKEATYRPIADSLIHAVKHLDPAHDIVFLVRTAALAPAIYRSAILLDEMHRRTMVPIVLFYPGTATDGGVPCFMGIPDRGGSPSNYRVKIYGGE